MVVSNLNELAPQLTKTLDNCDPVEWDDIISLLNQIKNKTKPSIGPPNEGPLKLFAKGTAFITFNYGIDGVSIEISKYAQILNNLFSPSKNSSIHLIGGTFYSQAKSILSAEWIQLQLDGIDGWDKWEGGKWYEALFKREMRPYSAESNLLAKEVYKQAVSIAKRLGDYFITHQISLVIPVNVASNPGNFALSLGLVLVTEIFGIYVLNSNHDFFWEDGKPPSERKAGEEPGSRDHFFRNMDNKSFFKLLEMIFPWDGNRWIQVNINARQSRKLINNFNFPKEKVFEISTCINDSLFEPYSRSDMLDIRLRMGHILSNGKPIMRPIPIADHIPKIEEWMKHQRPVILGARPRLSIDPMSDDLIILLQPTRVVSRKRIDRDLELIHALFRNSSLKGEFEINLNRQLILHITGPTPKEHQADLEKVLFAFEEILKTLPGMMADRIFLAFSVGYETHPSFEKNKFNPISIEEIYRMADVVMFPSETEGRGLPIIEASAIGIPIICSHYSPKEVFSDVIGEGLPEELQIRYTLFPEGKFYPSFLSAVADLLFNPEVKQNVSLHNKEAVRARYSTKAFKNKFERILNQLYNLN
ncbi:MAG: glycosyltransferase [Anaerolineae bacterium]|nr:glycosyltransferase [Anaerolineae bacterium]MDK1118814.1 glycosyltransferase [Anaerolineae bacterium]